MSFPHRPVIVDRIAGRRGETYASELHDAQHARTFKRLKAHARACLCSLVALTRRDNQIVQNPNINVSRSK